ncbi:MAG: hypothetical protein V4457_09255 [Pseudomonadota bacterium]
MYITTSVVANTAALMISRALAWCGQGDQADSTANAEEESDVVRDRLGDFRFPLRKVVPSAWRAPGKRPPMQVSVSAYLRIGTARDAMCMPVSTPFSIIRRHVMCPSLIAVFGRTLTESIALDDVQRNIWQR